MRSANLNEYITFIASAYFLRNLLAARRHVLYCIKWRVAHRLVSSTLLSALNQVISGMGCASNAHSITKFSPSCRIVGLCGNLMAESLVKIHQPRRKLMFLGPQVVNPALTLYMHVTSQVNKSCVLLLFLHISYIFLFLTFLDTFVPPKREIYFEIVDTNITKESYASYSTFF